MSKRKRRSAAERRAMVESWRKSGKSRSGFARELGVSPNSLRRWIREFDPPAFVEVVTRKAPGPAFLVRAGAAEIVVPAGFDGPELRRLVEALC